MYREAREPEIGHALSAVVVSLMRTLVRKDVLSNADVRALLTKAASEISPHEYAAPAAAPRAGGALARERQSASGADQTAADGKGLAVQGFAFGEAL